jgi:hypothetical protein
MTPTSILPDPQLAVRHQQDLRAAAAQARFARVATRTFAIDRVSVPTLRRGLFRAVTEVARI